MKSELSIFKWARFVIAFSSIILIQYPVYASSQPEITSTLEVLRDTELGTSSEMICGPVCLYVALRSMGVEGYSLDEVAKMSDWNYVDGTSMLGLERACKKAGLHAESFRSNLRQLKDLMLRNRAYAIIAVDEHFYLLSKVRGTMFLIITTSLEPKWLDRKRLGEEWDGKVLLFSQQPLTLRNPLKRMCFWGGVGGLLLSVAGIGHLMVGKRRERNRRSC